jgi:lysophospholipase
MNFTETKDNPAPIGGRVDTIVTEDGMRIRAAHWRATAREPKGTVIVLHGHTEFIEKYFETVADLLRRGFAVATLDWRGQGRSQREIVGRCHVESFGDYDRDLDAFMRHIVLPDCPQPFFLLAHSLGALVGLRAARDGRVRFNRLTLTAPMLALSRLSTPPMGLVRTLTALGLFLGRDGRAVGNKALRARYSDAAEDVRPKRIAEVLRAAPDLETGLPTVRWLHSAIQAMREVDAPSFAQGVKQPVMLIASGRDRVVSNAAIEQFTGDLRSGAQIIVAGARHEVLMEPDPLREEFWAAFDAFIPGGDPYDIASDIV